MVVTNDTYPVPLPPFGWACGTKQPPWLWDTVPPLAPFISANGRQMAVYQTLVRICADPQWFYVRFDCEDPDIWGNYSQRDQPIYNEEVVELFLAPGQAHPTRYFEFEVSPKGVLFDAQIINSTPNREDIEVHHEWQCPDIQWWVTSNHTANRWSAELIIPWAAIAPPGQLPTCWRANFCRIERPRGHEPEFSCWSPTYTEPADFHRPARFGQIELPF